MAIPGVARSQRLIAWNSSVDLQSPAFVCPEGYVTLVKSFYATNKGTAASYCTLQAVGAGGTVGVYINRLFLDVDSTQGGEVWAVLHPGEWVYVFFAAAAIDAWVSGAILAGGPQFPPAERADPLVWPTAPSTLPAPSEAKK